MRISSGTRAFYVFEVFGIQGVITKYRECLRKKIIFRNGITRLEHEHFLLDLIHLGEVFVYVTLPGTFPSRGNTTSTFLPLQQRGSLGSCNVFLALISTTTSNSGYQTQTRLFKSFLGISESGSKESLNQSLKWQNIKIMKPRSSRKPVLCSVEEGRQ